MRNYLIPMLIFLIGVTFATMNTFASAEVPGSLVSASHPLLQRLS